MSRVLHLFVSCLVMSCCAAAFAGDQSTWISASSAIQQAVQARPGTTPFKVEMYITSTMEFYEAKTFSGDTVFEIKINANGGQVFDIDDSDGGGAQDKIEEAQFVYSQSNFTLTQAIAHVEALFPDYFLTMIETEDRDGVAIFDVRMVRGAYRLELRISPSTGAILRQQLKLMNVTTPLYDIFIPDLGPTPNVGALRTAKQMITTAEQQFSARIFELELKNPATNTFRYEVRLYKNNTVIKAKFNAKTGALQSSSVVTDSSYITKVKNSINAAPLTLRQAIDRAKTVVPGGFVDEAKLRLQNAGKLYGVEFLTEAGELEVKVNSTTGAIKSISFED